MSDSYKILIVDDEPRLCESLNTLISNSGYKTETACSGIDAINRFGYMNFDLALLDIGLPDMDGYRIVDYLADKSPDTAVIMMTGNANVDSALQAVRRRVYDYVRKPFEHDILMNTIEKAIGHKRLEVALRESEARFHKLSDATWEGIVIFDNEIILEGNRQFYEMFGYRYSESDGKKLFSSKFVSELFKSLNIMVDSGDIGHYETTCIKKDGTLFTSEARARGMEYHGKMVKVAAIRDITLRKKVEKEKLELQEKLARASKMEALGLMAGSVAHDLNNILSGLVSYPELLLMDLPEDSNYRKPIEMIYNSGQKAAAVVSDLITIARGAINNSEILNLNYIIKEYLISAEHNELVKRYPNIKITTRVEPELFNVKCSPLQFSKALMNLARNAFEAIGKSGEIIITTQNRYLDNPVRGYDEIPKGEYAVFSISDNGEGIFSEDLDRIFEPFYTKKILGRSGTGLGLMIVWNTVKDSMGYLDVTSNKKGTRFDLYFPISREKATITTRQVSIEDYSGNGERILVVDDQESQREIASGLLSRLGYAVEAVSSGEKAVEYLAAHGADLIVLDMIMEPGISGLETFKRIKAMNPGQKAIIASGFSVTVDVKEVRSLGAGKFVKKPYTSEGIGMAVKEELLRYRPSHK